LRAAVADEKKTFLWGIDLEEGKTVAPEAEEKTETEKSKKTEPPAEEPVVEPPEEGDGPAAKRQRTEL
jgi:hypothetical protein